MANYPVHNGKLEEDNRIKTLEDLNPDYFYFCKVDVITPPTDLVFPILPVRHKDHIEWSAKIIYQGTYTSIDLFEASSRGYIIGNIVQCIVCKDSTTLLQSSLTQLYEKRVESQDPVMRDVLKLIMNSIYGRMGQKDIKTFYSLYRKNSEGGLDMTGRKQLYRCNVVSTEELVHDRGYLIEEVRKTPVLMPVNIAAEILSNSKVVMNKLIDLCGGIENPCGYYSDTDSLYVSNSKIPYLKSKGLIGTGLGQYKNDLGSNKHIILGFFPQPKIKFCVAIDDDGFMYLHRTMKGMTNTVDVYNKVREYKLGTFEFEEHSFYSWLKLCDCLETEINQFTSFIDGSTIKDKQRQSIKRLIGLGLINNFNTERTISLLHRKTPTNFSIYSNVCLPLI